MTTTTATSLRHLLNKENQVGCFQTTITESGGLNGKETKRKALGDVANTANFNRAPIGMTPKTGLVQKHGLNQGTPKLFASGKSLGSKLGETPCKEREEHFPPVEKHHATPMDTFDDIFSSHGGRLTSMFINDKELGHVAHMPTSNRADFSRSYGLCRYEDKYHTFEVESDQAWHSEIKRLQKTIKKREKQLLNQQPIRIFHDVPELMDPLPEIELILDEDEDN